MPGQDPRKGTFIRSYRIGSRSAGLFGVPAAQPGRFAHYNLYDLETGRLINRLWPLWREPTDAEARNVTEQETAPAKP